MEKTLDGGNTTTESKLVREFYSNIRKDPSKEKKEDDDYSDEYELVDDEEKSEEDADDWSKYSGDPTFASQHIRDRDFHAWFSKIDIKDSMNIWRRFPRSEWSHENTSWDKPNEKTIVEKKVPVMIKKKIPYSVYKHVPYEIKVPQPYTEKRVSYPVKVYVNVPVEIPEPYQVEQIPYKVKVDNSVPYKVEVSVSQLFRIEKRIPVEVKIP